MNKGDSIINYKYDMDGIRTEKIVDGVTTHYYTRSGLIIAQDNDTDKLFFQYDSGGKLFGINVNDSEYLYVRNIQGDVIAITDLFGTVQVEYTYDSWGKIESVTGPMAETLGRLNPMRYRGYYYDEETRYYYLQSRYYDPEWGRFINADTTEVLAKDNNAIESNISVYCNNDPVNRIDATGYYSVKKALAYAAKWWNNINPAFPKNGNDCANFVSQCLHAGGWWMTPSWFYLRVKNIPIVWHLGLLTSGIVLHYWGNIKLKVTNSWGTVKGLKKYLTVNRKLKATEYTTASSFANAVKKGKVKNGAVVFQYTKNSNSSHHAVMIGRIDKKKGIAYYYGHTDFRNAMNNSSNVAGNMISSKYKIYVINIS
ncbi:amidase domain-containing protein [Massilimaliae timonensis]|uniref:Amidase domain-containing protein n=1 Tax=Massiliimalia timonensis TaxID=1987501 RepID=A0A8J6P2C5_9FIRM|nr:amidase domain-containing protein [Massiliimalia timonensis]MBC8611614.1 amidase domain-containing protein [Massiliimalia timonensis]